jgi:mRNA interferase MazF
MTPGDVVWINDPRLSGHEQSGRRPAVILQDDGFAHASPLLVLVPLTSQVAAARFPATIIVEPSAANGLSKRSVALVFQIRAADRRLVGDRLGSAGAETLAAIHVALDRLLGRAAGAP